MLLGVLHIHSTYSDGEFALPELRDLFVADGCRFACVTDHADAFDGDSARLQHYLQHCDELSDETFRFIAGLEYTCDGRMHILGYGTAEPIASSRPEQVIARIRALGGVAVIAHPNDSQFDVIERLDPQPDGIEVWNSKYDGRYAPRPATFALLERIKRRQPAMHAFYGQDLHWRRQYRRLFVEVAAPAPGRRAILAALAAGRFAALKEGRRLPSDGVLPAALLDQFGRTQSRSRSIRRWIRRMTSWADQNGVGVPAPLKSQLRRIF